MRSNDDFPIARSDGRHILKDQHDLDLDRHGKLVTTIVGLQLLYLVVSTLKKSVNWIILVKLDHIPK